MKIEIKLKNPKYCEGCPKVTSLGVCLETKEVLKLKLIKGYLIPIRPRECIKEKGL